MVRPVSQWNGRCYQQIRAQCGVKQPVAGIERFVRKIHLGDQSLEPAVNFEVNMRRAHPIRTCGISAGFYGFDPIGTGAVRLNADATDKVWVEWRGIGVVDV